MEIILSVIAIWNLTVFAMYGSDKRKAVKDKWRISERTLLVSSFLFGGIGAFFGMRVWHHKTRHTLFRVLVPISAVITTILTPLVIKFFVGGDFLDFEFAILEFIQKSIACPFLDFLMPRISALGNHGAIWIILCVVLLCTKKYRKYGIYMAFSLAVAFVLCNLTLKPLVGRIRTFDARNIELLIAPPKDFSFPSGHTTASFAAAFAYREGYIENCAHKRKALIGGITVLIFVLAAAMGFSRLYLYVHYPTDVIGGFILGALTGIFVPKAIKNVIRH